MSHSALDVSRPGSARSPNAGAISPHRFVPRSFFALVPWGTALAASLPAASFAVHRARHDADCVARRARALVRICVAFAPALPARAVAGPVLRPAIRMAERSERRRPVRALALRVRSSGAAPTARSPERSPTPCPCRRSASRRTRSCTGRRARKASRRTRSRPSSSPRTRAKTSSSSVRSQFARVAVDGDQMRSRMTPRTSIVRIRLEAHAERSRLAFLLFPEQHALQHGTLRETRVFC